MLFCEVQNNRSRLKQFDILTIRAVKVYKSRNLRIRINLTEAAVKLRSVGNVDNWTQ